MSARAPLGSGQGPRSRFEGRGALNHCAPGDGSQGDMPMLENLGASKSSYSSAAAGMLRLSAGTRGGGEARGVAVARRALGRGDERAWKLGQSVNRAAG